MTVVALKMLLGDRLKYLGLIVGIAFAALLITQQAGILVGLAHMTGSFIRDTSQADIWLMDKEVRFSQDSLPLQDTMLYRVRGIEGVEWAVPLYTGFLRVRLPDGTRRICILVGIDDATLTGALPKMVQGTLADFRKDRTVFIDETVKDTKFMMKRGGNRGLVVGDRISIMDNDAFVAGTFTVGQSFFWEPVIYTTYSRAIRYAPADRRVMTYCLIKAKPGVDKQELCDRIEKLTNLQARSNDQFIKLTMDYILKETGILINFGMAVMLGFIVGALIAGQMLYNFTLDNLRHYGALKAMGATTGMLIRMVLLQASVVGFIGYGLGVGGAALLGSFMARNGGLAFLLPWQIPVLTAFMIGSIVLLAGLISLFKVIRLEPAVVFKA